MARAMAREVKKECFQDEESPFKDFGVMRQDTRMRMMMMADWIITRSEMRGSDLMRERGSTGWARLLVIGLGLVMIRGWSAEPAVEESGVRALLDTYCVKCHGTERPKGGFSLTRYPDLTSVQKDPHRWQTVIHQLRDRTMPPDGKPQPKPEERERMVDWVTATLNNIDESLMEPDPGRALIRRLSRQEYNFTIRDWLGVTNRPADKFPADGGGGAGFDNAADTLFVPPILMEKYLNAADEILASAPRERVFVFGMGGRASGELGRAKKLAEYHGLRAYRRPLEREEVAAFLRVYEARRSQGVDFESAAKSMLKAMLVSPQFLFRSERQPEGSRPQLVDDYELASRLSYFIWSSLPDETLFEAARRHRLRDAGRREAEVRRMLKDPKARALAENFAGQWLGVRNLRTSAAPDAGKFPEYTSSLRESMIGEAEGMFGALLKENGTLLDLLDADYTYLNEELARFYGISGVFGNDFRRVPITDRNRGGVLGMAGVLTLTSYPQRTSPVLRGKWVLEEILGAPSPPPPPNVGGLPAEDAPKEGLTFRQRLEKHRTKPDCASCHKRMDPIGFGLENFDAIGRWRTSIGGKRVDASGVLATGEPFDGPMALKRLILERKPDFVRNVAEKMFGYALGRGLEYYDMPSVKRAVEQVSKRGYGAADLVMEVVHSYPFRYRRGAEAGAGSGSPP